MTVVLAVVAPHGDLAIPELCSNATRDLARATQHAMGELGRRAGAASIDCVVIASPHHLHLERSFGVVTSARLAGDLAASEPGVGPDAGPEGEPAASRIALDCAVDRDLARVLLEALDAAGQPATGVSFGGNVPEEAVMPMDWGSLIPLWYLGGRFEPQPSVVLITPARDLGGAAHVEAGRAIGRALAKSSKRILFVASADQSHTHDPAGPYGGDPAAPVFDTLVTDAIAANQLHRLREVPADLIEAAKPDAWWQLLLLDGVLDAAGGPFRAELLAYEAPTYYGMTTAAFTPELPQSGPPSA